MTDQALHALRQRLRDAGLSNPEREARLILVHGLDPDVVLARRAAGEPLSRILGTQEFWSLEFALSPDTLDPRQDTETLVEAALRHYGTTPPERILDIGTGTGCILIALLREWPDAVGVATDISAGAIAVARANAGRHGIADRATFVQTSWAGGIAGPFDLVVSNPPYIRRDVIPNLDKNVRDHDPILALDGGFDGLEAYRSILTEMKNVLAPGGRFFFEIGYDQSDSVMRLVENTGATPERIIADLGGNPRVVQGHMGISVKRVDGDS